MVRYCANCGTEVDDTAVFCPTCGQPIDQAAEVAMPEAPAWPDPVPEASDDDASPPESLTPRVDESGQGGEGRGQVTAPSPVVASPPAAPRPVAPTQVAPSSPARPDHGVPAAAGGRSAVNLPITWPLMLSGWLIGAGAMLAVLGIVVGLFRGVAHPLDLVLAVALLAIAVAVFFAASVPRVPNLRLVTLAVALVGFGIALDRIVVGFADVGDVLLILGTAAAALGSLLIELGRDQPLGGGVG